MTAAASIRLADYTPWAFELPSIVLDVNIQDDHVVVASRLSLEPRRPGEPLVLPVAMALVGEQGRVGEEQLLVMEAERASITLQGQPGDTPLPSPWT